MEKMLRNIAIILLIVVILCGCDNNANKGKNNINEDQIQNTENVEQNPLKKQNKENTEYEYKDTTSKKNTATAHAKPEELEDSEQIEEVLPSVSQNQQTKPTETGTIPTNPVPPLDIGDNMQPTETEEPRYDDSNEMEEEEL